MKKKVEKAAGDQEEFDIDKLSRSLLHCGASQEMADTVARNVYDSVGYHTSSSKVYYQARRELNRLNPSTALRYSLKRALFRLGPTGYPFELYFSRILEEYGYTCRTNLFLQGRCVEHEVDILAENGKEISVIECKYHNRGGRRTDVKVALYVQARVDDLKGPLLEKHSQSRYVGWLVTNTRLTSMAIRYGRCMGLRLTGWKYPENKGLERLIEDKALYPVTLLSGLKRGSATLLIKNGIVLLKDLLEMGEEELASKLRMGRRRAANIIASVRELCHNKIP